jgi:putative iron-dependent peroxidase
VPQLDSPQAGLLTNAPAAPPGPQAVVAPLTRDAIFLVVTVHPDEPSRAAVRELCADVAALVRSVGIRDSGSALSCVVGIGAQAWDDLVGSPRPAGLHPFAEIRGARHTAVSTPGDLLFHIRAGRADLCFELATQIMRRLRTSVTVVDEVHGFRYFDARDLIGFVDSTENPIGAAAVAATVIGAEDPAFAGGSYVIVQKYLHDMDTWNAIPVEEQERVIGRSKLDDIELADDVKPSNAHNALTSITDEDGNELQILRDNMPFGDVGRAEFGTYFIGYSNTPAVTERMLVNMFVGDPPGNYDRLLDFSLAITGTLFFVPSAPLLESLDDMGPSAAAAAPDASAGPAASAGSAAGGSDAAGSDAAGSDAVRVDANAGAGALGDGSLGIGSLKGVAQP